MEDVGDIATIAPQLLVQAEVKGASVILAGIDPVAESKIKSWWQVSEGTYLNGAGEALVGSTAAELLNMNVGDTFDVKGQNLSVAGILGETGSGDDYRIFVPLKAVQTAFDKQGLLTTVDIRALCNACPVEIIADFKPGVVPTIEAQLINFADEIAYNDLLDAAHVAATVVLNQGTVQPLDVRLRPITPPFYVSSPIPLMDETRKYDLLRRMDAAARAVDPKIVSVRIEYQDDEARKGSK